LICGRRCDSDTKRRRDGGKTGTERGSGAMSGGEFVKSAGDWRRSGCKLGKSECGSRAYVRRRSGITLGWKRARIF